MSVQNDPIALPKPRPPARRGKSASPRANPGHVGLAILLYAFFAVFLIWPIVQVCYTGFVGPDGSFTSRYVGLIFSSPVLREGLINATLVAVLVTALALVDLAAAGGAERALRLPRPGAARRVAARAAGAAAVRRGNRHSLSAEPARAAHAARRRRRDGDRLAGQSPPARASSSSRRCTCIPIMLLNLQAALANIDPALEQAAANIGASRWTILREVTLAADPAGACSPAARWC